MIDAVNRYCDLQNVTTLERICLFTREHMFDNIKVNICSGSEVKGMEDNHERKIGDGYPVNIPIQMFCAVDTTGKITPIRFRYETEDHSIEMVQIENTISRDEKNYAGIREKQFICTAIVEKRRTILEIRYHIENQKSTNSEIESPSPLD